MPRVAPHHHKCVDCGVKTECPGTWEENYDGWPEVICDDVDKRHNDPICDECYEKREAADKEGIES